MNQKTIRKLHIGGKIRVEGWEVLNAVPGDHVDHLGNANDLSLFEDNTFSAIYASHIAEHLDYKDELPKALHEWHRALTSDGILYISVPDLDILCRLFLDKNKFDASERYQIMRIIFGGHTDKYDYHVAGLNQEFLVSFLVTAGFKHLERVQSFGLFADTSDMNILDEPISLNIVAKKLKP